MTTDVHLSEVMIIRANISALSFIFYFPEVLIHPIITERNNYWKEFKIPLKRVLMIDLRLLSILDLYLRLSLLSSDLLSKFNKNFPFKILKCDKKNGRMKRNNFSNNLNIKFSSHFFPT